MESKKGQLGWSQLVGWIIAVLVLALVIVFFVVLRGKGVSAIDYLKDLFRFGR